MAEGLGRRWGLSLWGVGVWLRRCDLRLCYGVLRGPFGGDIRPNGLRLLCL